MTAEEIKAQEAAEKEAADKAKLSPEQQEAVNKQIQARLARERDKVTKEVTDSLTNKFNTDLEEKMAALRNELKPPTEDGKELSDKEKAIREQHRQQLEAEQLKAKALENKFKEKDTLSQQLAARLKETEKRQAINEAMNGLGFHKPSDVVKLTQDSIEYDETLKTYVVKENGVIKENLNMEPMTLTEYFTDYAAKNSWFVNSDTTGGTGAVPGKNGGVKTVTKKSDFKGDKQKSDFIAQNGYQAFEDLPA